MGKDNYSYLSGKYDIPGRYKKILDQLQTVIAQLGITNIVVVNEDLLGKAIIDYFEDIDRLKDFEEIERVCVAKIYAHETYWLMRRKPIQAEGINEDDERWLYINEIACTTMLISKMYEEAGVPLKQGVAKLKDFYSLLFYNLKYRKFTQQSLELMIEAFLLGTMSSGNRKTSSRDENVG